MATPTEAFHWTEAGLSLDDPISSVELASERVKSAGMKSWHARETLRWALLCWGLLGTTACQEAPSNLREWAPEDHKNTGGSGAGAGQARAGQVQPAQVQAGGAAGAPASDPPPGLDPVTLSAWTTHCSSCHGKIGRGDGPQGLPLKATDLSNPDWQKGVSDEQIRSSITKGKGLMPPFPNLPVPTVDNLVLLVRWFNSDQEALKQRLTRIRGGAPQRADSTTPTSATTSPPSSPVTPTTAQSAGAASSSTGASTRSAAGQPAK